MNIWKEIKNRFLAIVWFYKMCHNKRLEFHYDKEFWSAWREEHLDIFTDDSISALKRGVDSESISVLNNFIQKLAIDLELRKAIFLMFFLLTQKIQKQPI